MLARVANNLFWMGRYIERSEHIARYLRVNYFSSLDAPNQISQSRQFVLRSMLTLVGDPDANKEGSIDEAEDPNYHSSIINNVRNARENANSARDLISTELYESINKFYHFISQYDANVYTKNGLDDFTRNVTEMSAILRGKVRSTLMHDEIYAIIIMGANIERATQVMRIISAKYNDALKAQGSYGDKFKNSFEWTTLLKCTESYDMMRRHYKKTPTSITTLEFLILNPNCPRSIMNSLNQVCKHIKILDNKKKYDRDSTSFLVGKVRAEYEFKSIVDIEKDIQLIINDTLNHLYEISQKMEKEFFSY